tara:strand:- start:846 stop:1250 length:405 start_codon:yes stop_codon:yes gene_type:complete
MKQANLFSKKLDNSSGLKKYSSNIQSPIYEPKNKKPHVLELRDKSKTNRLIMKIEASNLSDQEKDFLKDASTRHTIFNYELIAEYYAHSNKEMQELMEESALVIIDFEKAVQSGYVRLCEDIRKQFLEDYEDEE